MHFTEIIKYLLRNITKSMVHLHYFDILLMSYLEILLFPFIYFAFSLSDEVE